MVESRPYIKDIEVRKTSIQDVIFLKTKKRHIYIHTFLSTIILRLHNVNGNKGSIISPWPSSFSSIFLFFLLLFLLFLLLNKMNSTTI